MNEGNQDFLVSFWFLGIFSVLLQGIIKYEYYEGINQGSSDMAVWYPIMSPCGMLYGFNND